MTFYNREDVIALSPHWKGERFDDGRPRVSDQILDRLRDATIEEVWAPMWDLGFKYQFEGSLNRTNQNRKMIGRALTTVMLPSRPDVHMQLLRHGQNEEGRRGFFNQWVVDELQEGDILVVDMCDKVYQGTFVGGNLSTAIKSRTKNGGAIVWGGIRDLSQIISIEDFQLYYRGIDPTPIGDVMLGGINVPCRIGNAICMPGDVVIGTESGVIFIPAHLAEDVAVRCEKTKVKDMFGFERLQSGTYRSADIDRNIWSKAVFDDFLHWFSTSPLAQDYQYLDWTAEKEEVESGKDGEFTGIVSVKTTVV